tara:strand:+ start:1002 stop:1229 length:228 start_codon:yes stop_codon:yes gene_type:complete
MRMQLLWNIWSGLLQQLNLQTSYHCSSKNYQMTNNHSKEFIKKIGEQIQRLREEGKLDEANSLQLTYFPSMKDTK